MASTQSSGATRAEQAVAAVLPSPADVTLAGAGERYDLVVNGQQLQVKWIGEGRLGDVRRLLTDR